MYLQEILEVGVGLVFMWLVMSIAAMSLQEWLANLLQWRPKAMQKAVQQLVVSQELVKQVYSHPVVTGLSGTTPKQGKSPRLPSYMPANKFSLALFDIITKAGVETSPVAQVTDAVNTKLDEVLKGPEQRKVAAEDWKSIQDTAQAAVTSQTSLDSLKSQIQIFGERYPEVQPALDGLLPKVDSFYQSSLSGQNTESPVADNKVPMSKVHLGLKAMKQDPKLKDSAEAIAGFLNAMELQGALSLAQARVHIETWFNDSMDRLQGVYKRKTQVTAFIIGTILAFILNVDSIHVAASLWREPTLRQSIVAEAQSYANQNQNLPTPPASPTTSQAISNLQTQLQVLNIPFGWTSEIVDTGGRQCALIPFRSNQIWGIPGQNAQGGPSCKQLNDVPLDPASWLVKVLGFLITGLATAQGAPFWFDILKKMVNVRGSGPNPAEQTPVG